MSIENPRFNQFSPERNPVEAAKEKVMTAAEYAEMEHERPYVYKVQAGEKSLTYFGSPHTRTPRDPVLEKLEQSFEQADPDLVLVEGIEALQDPQRNAEGRKWLKNHSPEEATDKGGEGGFAVKLAADNDVEFNSPEPRRTDEVAHLLQRGFSKEEVFAEDFGKTIAQWHRQQSKGELSEYLQPHLESFQKATQWEGFDYTYEHAEQIARDIWGEGINTDDPEYYTEKTDPIPWEGKKGSQTAVNEVARESSRFRDQHIVGEIDAALQNHDRVFIVYGASHAVMQEPAIRELMKKYEQPSN